MLIEAASARLAIDLLESLRKFKLTATEIRVSFINKGGTTMFMTFHTLDELKKFYNDKFAKIVNARRDPFTKDRKKAQLTPTVVNGLIVGKQAAPVNDSKIPGFCELGRFISIESFRLQSSSFNYDAGFICKDVSSDFTIVENRQLNLRKNTSRNTDVKRHKSSVESYIKDYQTILKRLFRAYNANLYVDLCYVEIGYVVVSILLYNIFFALVKERLDSGLRISVLEPRYLKKIE